MAIDTAIKRKAASGIPFLPLTPGVTPNSSKNSTWRATVGWGYPLTVSVIVVVGRTINCKWQPQSDRTAVFWEDKGFALKYLFREFNLDWHDILRLYPLYTIPDIELSWTNITQG